MGFSLGGVLRSVTRGSNELTRRLNNSLVPGAGRRLRKGNNAIVDAVDSKLDSGREPRGPDLVGSGHYQGVNPREVASRFRLVKKRDNPENMMTPHEKSKIDAARSKIKPIPDTEAQNAERRRRQARQRAGRRGRDATMLSDSQDTLG